MHELAITQSIVAGVRERVGALRVRRVVLEVGALSAISVEAIRFCFDACTAGTLLAGSELEIIEVRGRGRCRACGVELSLAALFAECACGSFDVEVRAGQELRIRWVEVD